MSILVFQKCQNWQGWGCIQAGVVLFLNQFWTGVVLLFEGGEVLFKSGVAFARIRYIKNADSLLDRVCVNRGGLDLSKEVL